MGKTEITTSHLEEEKGVPEEMSDQVIQVKLSELHPFEGHPFKVLDDETMENTVESIKQIGIAVKKVAQIRFRKVLGLRYTVQLLVLKTASMAMISIKEEN